MDRQTYRELEIFEAFYEIDALLSMAFATQKYCLSFPIISDNGKTIKIQQLKHFFLSNGIGYDLEINDKNFIFLT